MKLPPEWKNENLVERIEADPGALNAISHLAQADASTFATSICSGLLIDHADGTEECTLSAECTGGKHRHDVQITCSILSPCTRCAA